MCIRDRNYDRVQEELEYNKEEIRLYKGRLEIYKKLYETYFERKKVLDEMCIRDRGKACLHMHLMSMVILKD